ncbi:MAG: hypothetical protein AB3N28_08210 [Kordiimonas sp.]
MILKLSNNRVLQKWQILFVAALLLVQGSAAVLAAEHAAAGNSKYLCGNGSIPAEAVANIKALLALQGELDEEESTACEICSSVAVGNFSLSGVKQRPSLLTQVLHPFTINAANTAKITIGAPLGLRAPPNSTL